MHKSKFVSIISRNLLWCILRNIVLILFLRYPENIVKFFQHIVTYPWACCYSAYYGLFSTQFPILPFKPIGKISFSLYTLWTCMGNGGVTALILNLGQVGVEWSVPHSTCFNSAESVLITYRRIGRWAPNVVQTLRDEKYLLLLEGIELKFHACLICILVTMLTMLFLFLLRRCSFWTVKRVFLHVPWIFFLTFLC
jgi:hypothetical protein